jgi:hypothetical protein
VGKVIELPTIYEPTPMSEAVLAFNDLLRFGRETLDPRSQDVLLWLFRRRLEDNGDPFSLDNLTTLCAACHRHPEGGGKRSRRRAAPTPIPGFSRSVRDPRS